jgi:hypothetical protein
MHGPADERDGGEPDRASAAAAERVAPVGVDVPVPVAPAVAQDGALLGKLTRIVVEAVHAFYAERAAREGALDARTGAVTVVQRTSSDLRLNPHLHLVALDGAWYEQGGELSWQGLGHLQTSEVGAVLESTVRRIERHLRRRGLLGIDEDGADPDVPGDPESNLAASAVSGQTPPGGPQWRLRLEPHRGHMHSPVKVQRPSQGLARVGERPE